MLIDSKLDQISAPIAQKLRGQAAIVCAHQAYQEYRKITVEERWKRIEANGANTQRLLWASTSPKDPAYSDVKYVEVLIGPNTINTMPIKTIGAYRDHGMPELRIEEKLDEIHELSDDLAALNIKFNVVSDELERQGVEKFIEPYDRLLATLAQRSQEIAS